MRGTRLGRPQHRPSGRSTRAPARSPPTRAATPTPAYSARRTDPTSPIPAGSRATPAAAPSASTAASYVTITNTGLLEPPKLAVDAWVRRSGSPGRWRYVLSNGSLAVQPQRVRPVLGLERGHGFYVSSATEYVISPEVSPRSCRDGGVAPRHRLLRRRAGAAVDRRLAGRRGHAGHAADRRTRTAAAASTSAPTAARATSASAARSTTSRCGTTARRGDDRPRDRPGAPTRRRRSRIGAGTGTPAPGATATQPKGCLRVSLSRSTIPVRRRTKLVATVRRGGRRVAGVAPRGQRQGRHRHGPPRTDRKGKTKIAVRARKAGRLEGQGPRPEGRLLGADRPRPLGPRMAGCAHAHLRPGRLCGARRGRARRGG